MAVYSGISGKRRGSVGNETYTITRGQNIVRAKVIETTNPRTRSQMLQRASFASAVRLYQLATQSFFRFAFEDKKERESDYNAFMRHNISRGAVVPPVNTTDVPDYPCLGDWEWTNGRLPLSYTAAFGGTNGNFFLQTIVKVNGDYSSSQPATMGELATLLAEKGVFALGDIITIPVMWYEAIYVPGQIIPQGTQANSFKYAQMILDASDTTTIGVSEADINGVGVSITGTASGLSVSFKVHFEAPAEQLAGLIAQGSLIRSQLPAGGKLLVSTSGNKMSAGAENLFTMLQTDVVRERILQMWKAKEGAILEGKG